MKSLQLQQSTQFSRPDFSRLERSPLAGHGRPVRVLVADDSLLARAVARRLFEAAGFEVLEASSGEAVLQLLLREEIDLLLTDLHMPGLDGIETTRWIRRLEQMRGGKRVPIVAVTASASPAEREECLEAGMDLVLPKEFRLSDLAPFLPPNEERDELQ